jgi:hypothetical protein
MIWRGWEVDEADLANEAAEADEPDLADKATDATEADRANKADMVSVSKANETDKANKAIATDVTNATNKADLTNNAIIADNADGAILYSLTKYSAIFTEVKGYFGITALNNQLGRRSSCSLRSKTWYQLDNQLEVVVEKGLVWSSKHGSNNQLGECVAEIGWKTWHNNKLANMILVEMGRSSMPKVVCGLEVGIL